MIIIVLVVVVVVIVVVVKIIMIITWDYYIDCSIPKRKEEKRLYMRK